jgi:hypothetical protein
LDVLCGGEGMSTDALKSVPTIDVICVAYKRCGPLKVLVQCFLNQVAANWKLTVYHDGYDQDFERLMQLFVAEAPDKISYAFSKTRHNDWGHSLREEGLKHLTSDYVLITNDDNYYVPVFISSVTQAIQATDPDIVLFDMIHSHDHPGGLPLPAYSYFQTEYKRHRIDIGAAVVRSSLAVKAGFRDKSHDGDATYFEDVAGVKGSDLKVCKIKQVLFVHN